MGIVLHIGDRAYVDINMNASVTMDSEMLEEVPSLKYLVATLANDDTCKAKCSHDSPHHSSDGH